MAEERIEGRDATPAETRRAGAPAARAMGRREALRLIGMAAAAVVPVPLVKGGLDGLMSGPGPVGEDPERPARTAKERLRRWAMVIDLRYCDGCQGVGLPPQCTQACIEGHLAPEPMEWIEVFEVEHGFESQHEMDIEPAAAEGSGQEHAGPAHPTAFLPVPCQQCQNPPCTNVCPVGATFSTPEGVVLIDQDRCIGCRICMAACPYDRRFFNWGEPPTPIEARYADYSPEHQVPARKGTVMKCDFCPDVARVGRLPYCVQACPNHAIYYGDLEEGLATNGRKVVDVEHFLTENHFTRLKDELGTNPRVYYIPGHGELVGRHGQTRGRLPSVWPWRERKGTASWQR